MSVATILKRIVGRSPTTAILDDLVASMEKPTLENLSYALRHPDVWPPGFKWDFSSVDTCAMGLAVGIWNLPGLNEHSGWVEYDVLMAKTFSLSGAALNFIFYCPNTAGPDGATPGDVANEIDGYLAANR